MNTLTPSQFDKLVDPPSRGRIIWTLPAIGRRIGRGTDFARTLAEKPGSPVRKIGGRYCAYEPDLVAYVSGANESPR